ncbi:MAG: sugar transferase, partial [Candidatus Binatia bacterium]
MKRLFDIVVSCILLVCLSPLLLVVTVLIWWEDGLPVLFRQTRVGRAGLPFEITKFRTMRASSAGPPITVGGDPRITRTGAWLRRWKLDELPQLWNVVRGDM